MMRFWRVRERILRGVKSLGVEGLRWRAVPEGGLWRGV